MNQPPSFKKIHIFAIAAGVLLVGIFFWSTLGASAFNGPTQNPSGGNGAIGTDSSNNVYIGGNLNVTGTISASGLGGSLISAANVSEGEFGDNTGGGEYDFPGTVSIGASSTGDGNETYLLIYDSGNNTGGFGVLGVEPGGANTFLVNDNPGDFIISDWGAGNIDINARADAYATLVIATSGFIGIGASNPLSSLDVYGGQLLVRDNDNGANYGTGIRVGYDGASGVGSPAIGFRVDDQSERFEISVPSSSVNTANERISISGDCSGGCPMTEYLSVNRYGFVGIGTTTPASPLTVVGNIYATGNITCGGTCGGGGSSQWTTTSTGIYYNGGGVGIGTAPISGNALSVGGNFTTQSGNVQINNYSTAPTLIFSNSYTAGPTISVDAGTSSPNLYLYGSRVTIGSNGNVGITGTLTVGSGSGIIGTNVVNSQYYQDPTQTAAYLQFANGGGTSYFNERGDTSTIGFQMLGAAGQTGDIFQITSSSNSVYFDVSASGKVGIGTSTPSFPLTVNGSSSAAAYCINGANCITAWPSTPSGANPSASIGTSAVNGSATTFMRSDGAPAINQAAAFSFSALGNTTSTGNITAASMNITSGASTASTIGGSAMVLGACNTATVTITGAVSSTGSVFVMPQKNPGSGVTWQGYVSALNTVTIDECAATATTPTATKFNAIYIY